MQPWMQSASLGSPDATRQAQQWNVGEWLLLDPGASYQMETNRALALRLPLAEQIRSLPEL
eukprot:1839592-Amphidinium_carterae.1